MIEQKLFFTRNGEYTIWEKIDSLRDEDLDFLAEVIRSSLKIELEETREYSNIKGKIYSIYKSNDNVRNVLNTEINRIFSPENASKCDFNANLYKIDLNYMNIDVAYKELKKLNNVRAEYEIDDIYTEVFLNKEDNCIDVRISSKKSNDYKDNSNEQIINTEVRIYFMLGLLVMTDYSDYTHNRKVKEVLLNNIYDLLNNNYHNKSSYKLSDITLRLLLKRSKKYASKFKFYVDDYVNVDFNITEDLGASPLEHSGLREFYDKHPISLIKISMSSNDDKYITVDGERGKLISRSKTMEIKDIDEFIQLLNDVIRYDYLNFDYKKNLRHVARRKDIGNTATILSSVNDTYLEVERKISECLVEKNDIDAVALTRNTFFYCLINKKIVNTTEQKDYGLDSAIIKQLSRWLDISNEQISSTFNYLIRTAIENSDDSLLEAFDNYINVQGDLNVS